MNLEMDMWHNFLVRKVKTRAANDATSARGQLLFPGHLNLWSMEGSGDASSFFLYVRGYNIKSTDTNLLEI